MMLKRSEIRKLEEKDKEWRKTVRHFNRQVVCVWGEVKIEMKKIINWYWFSNEKTKGGKALHIIMWCLITRAFIRLWWGV